MKRIKKISTIIEIISLPFLLFANHPKIAKEFAKKTPKGKKLPKRVKK